jgi:hypothetical protein
MGLLETKFQLERQIREAQALFGGVEQTKNSIQYYAAYGDEEEATPIKLVEIEAAISLFSQVIVNLDKQLKTLVMSDAYINEYSERYAVEKPGEPR